MLFILLPPRSHFVSSSGPSARRRAREDVEWRRCAVRPGRGELCSHGAAPQRRTGRGHRLQSRRSVRRASGPWRRKCLTETDWKAASIPSETSEGDTDAAAAVTSSSNDGPSRPAHGPSRSHRRHRPAHRPAHDQQVRRQRPPGTAFFNNYMLDMLHFCLSPRRRDVATFVLSRRMRRDRHAA